MSAAKPGFAFPCRTTRRSPISLGVDCSSDKMSDSRFQLLVRSTPIPLPHQLAGAGCPSTGRSRDFDPFRPTLSTTISAKKIFPHLKPHERKLDTKVRVEEDRLIQVIKYRRRGDPSPSTRQLAAISAAAPRSASQEGIEGGLAVSATVVNGRWNRALPAQNGQWALPEPRPRFPPKRHRSLW